MSKNQNIMISIGGIDYLDVTTIEKELMPFLADNAGDVLVNSIPTGEDRYTVQIHCKDKEAYFTALKHFSACVSD